jgi:hypothetical protein
MLGKNGKIITIENSTGPTIMASIKISQIRLSVFNFSSLKEKREII